MSLAEASGGKDMGVFCVLLVGVWGETACVGDVLAFC